MSSRNSCLWLGCPRLPATRAAVPLSGQKGRGCTPFWPPPYNNMKINYMLYPRDNLHLFNKACQPFLPVLHCRWGIFCISLAAINIDRLVGPVQTCGPGTSGLCGHHFKNLWPSYFRLLWALAAAPDWLCPSHKRRQTKGRDSRRCSLNADRHPRATAGYSAAAVDVTCYLRTRVYTWLGSWQVLL